MDEKFTEKLDEIHETFGLNIDLDGKIDSNSPTLRGRDLRNRFMETNT